MVLTKVLHQNCVKVPLESKDKNSAILELIDLLDNNGLLLDKKIVTDAVMVREQTRSTGIGSGIAIPHGKCKAVKELVMAFGITNDPIDFDSVDDKPVKIIILLVSPIDQTGPHIQALAKISSLMLDDKFREQLSQTTSAKQAYDLLSSKEQQ